MKNYHLVPRNGRWELSEEGGAALCTYETKDEAVKATSRVAFIEGGSVKIHKADGTFGEERTYPRAADPAGSPG